MQRKGSNVLDDVCFRDRGDPFDRVKMRSQGRTNGGPRCIQKTAWFAAIVSLMRI